MAGLIAFDWDSVDGVFEEDEEVFVHPRDPYTRIDVLRSSRRVRVSLRGTLVADSTRPSPTTGPCGRIGTTRRTCCGPIRSRSTMRRPSAG